MDWSNFITAITPIALAVIAIVGVYMNIRLADAKAAALAAVDEAKKLAETTSKKVDGVAVQLDGRITEFMEEMRKRANEQYAAGAAYGRSAALTGPIAAKIDKVQEHLNKQDEDVAARHEENSTKRRDDDK